MKRLTFVALAFTVAPSLFAATTVTVNWAAANDNGLGLSTGAPLPVGNEVRLGVFDFPSNSVNGSIQGFVSSGDLAGLASRFTLFDTAFIGTSAFPANLGSVPLNQRAGLFEDSSGGVNVPTGSPLFGRQLFLWAFKTTDNGPVASDFLNVTEVGFFSSNSASWFFPGDTGIPGSTSIEITNLSNSANNALDANARIPYGSFGNSTTTLATQNNFVFRLGAVTPVPEPSAGVFVALGMIPLLGLYRRRG